MTLPVPDFYWDMDAIDGGFILPRAGNVPITIGGSAPATLSTHTSPRGGNMLELATPDTSSATLPGNVLDARPITFGFWARVDSANTSWNVFFGTDPYTIEPVALPRTSTLFGAGEAFRFGGGSDAVIADGVTAWVIYRINANQSMDVAIEGTLYPGVLGPGEASPSSTSSVVLGINGSGIRPLHGALGDLAIWNEALTDDQLLESFETVSHRALVEVPMSGTTALRVLQYGKHTSTTQVEIDTSVTYGFAEPEGDPKPKYGPRKLERDLRRGDAEHYSRVGGPLDAPAISFATLLRGLNANSGGAVTTAKQTELAPLLDSIMGANGVGGTGSTVASSGHTSTVLTVADASAIPAGACVLFNDGTEMIAREVVSVSSNALTLDRAYSGTPTSSSTVFVAVSWHPLNSNPNHIHMAFDLESLGLERVKMFGCMGNLSIDFPSNGGLALCQWDFDGSHFTRPSPATPTFVAPTVGTPIPAIDGTFWLGTSELLLRDCKFSVAPKKTQKQHYAALNGFAGYIVTDIDLKLEGTLLMGALTGEAAASVLTTLQGTSVQDIAFQVGRIAGGAVYVRMPAADLDASFDTVDGQEAIKFTAMGTRSPNQANVPGSARLHLF